MSRSTSPSWRRMISWKTLAGRVSWLTAFAILSLLATVGGIYFQHQHSTRHLPTAVRQAFSFPHEYLLGWTVLATLVLITATGRLIGWYKTATDQPTSQLRMLATGQLPAPLPAGQTELADLVVASNQLVENLRQASAFATAIGEGHLQVPFQAVSPADTLGNALLLMRQRLLQVADEDKKRTWATQGMASFAELLRADNHPFSVLTDRITAHLVGYLGANQGALFVVEEGDESLHLSLAACYAYQRKKFIQQQIQPGEGLVGQCYLERDTIYLTQVPADYVRITSGLGEAPPRCLLLVPLKTSQTLEGVLELACFRPLEAFQIQFVEKVAESIAATLAAGKVAQRTRQLLEESQQQTEQMRAQEEEMRQNMEELQATQEEMHRKEQGHLQEIDRLHEQHHLQTASLQEQELAMRGVLSAIEGTLATIEFDLDGRILTANENFLRTMGYPLEEITGQHHRLFLEAHYAQSTTYASFWDELRSGQPQVGEVKRLDKAGKEVWLSASYTPVLDALGEPLKVIKFAQDITAQKHRSLDHQSQLAAIAKSNATIEFDLDGHILTANENFLSLMGYQLEEIQGRHHRLFVREQDRQSEEYSTFWAALRGGQFISGEFQRVNKAGLLVWIKGSYNAILDLNGQPYKVVKYAQDITRQKHLEEASQQQTEELRAQEEEIRQNLEELQATQDEVERKSLLLEAQATAIDRTLATIEFDLQGRILTANENFLRAMGYQLEEIVQQSHTLFIDVEYARSTAYAVFWAELRSGKAQVGKVARRTKQGREVWLNASYTPVFDGNHQPVKILKLALLVES